MSRAIGLRAEARQIHWAVVEGTQQSPVLVTHGKAEAPADVDEATGLSDLKDRVLLVVQTERPDRAIVRCPENVARGGNTDGARRRLRIEGVMLQAMHALGVPVTTAAYKAIAGKLGTKTPKADVERGEVRGIDVSSFTIPAREAVLFAVAALPQG